MTVGTRGACVWRVEDVECWPDTGVKPIIGRLLIIYINCEEHWSPGTGGPASIDRGQVGFNVSGIPRTRTERWKHII